MIVATDPKLMEPRQTAEPQTRPAGRKLRVMFALPGLHRVNRGAEVAFEMVADRLSRMEGFEATLIGSGEPKPGCGYWFRHAGCVPRESFRRWPHLPLLRSECMYEELSFAPRLWRAYSPDEFDVTVTCSYPYTNWVLRSRRFGRSRPAHVYVTQNGDWPCLRENREYRWFSCDGLVCTNPEYFERQRQRWQCALIPNGVDPEAYCPGPCDRSRLGLPESAPIVLMVSALIASKRVMEGIRAIARVPDAFLVLAGDGELREQVDALGRNLLGDRYRRLTLPRAEMPGLYRSADVFLHMSQIEAFGNVYIEALATGLPVVAHDRAVARWTLENQGILVDTDSEEQVAEGIRRGLETRSEEQVRSRRELAVRRYSWANIAEQYAAFFREVAQRRQQEARPA